MNKNIIDADINAFEKQVSQLLHVYENNPAITSFLKMMRSLGTYLNSRKNTAHPDSILVLNSISEQLDTIIRNPECGDEEINRILSCEINKYKTLKNKIISNPSINDTDITNLKAVILAIDWEISDITLQNFEEVVNNLLSKLKNYKIHHTFLKIIHSTGRYIGKQKANAHKDAISFLRSIFENFEIIIQTPDMSYTDKKQVLEIEITRFHEFKQKISRQKSRAHLRKDICEDEFIQPALSHIKSTPMHAMGTVVPLTSLPEQEDMVLTSNKTDSEKIAPAFANNRTSPTGPRDIMDDLFSIKESAADELLDEIHLMDVQGSNHGKTMNVFDRNRTSDFDGIKSFTPQQRNNNPIPEIGNRLDEFFNLDIREDPIDPTVNNMDQTIEIPTRENVFSAEGIVPFQDEDESFEESPQKYEDKGLLPETSFLDTFNRFKSTIKTSEWPWNESSILAMANDISCLEKNWQHDTEKTCLLEIISLFFNLLKNYSQTVRQKNEDMTDTTNKGISDAPQGNPVGIWGKIKGLFTF